MITRSVTTVLKEAIIVGILTAIVGIIFSKIMTKGSHPRLDSPYLISMIVCLILTGMAIHIGFEYTGLNHKFCETLLAKPDYEPYDEKITNIPF